MYICKSVYCIIHIYIYSIHINQNILNCTIVRNIFNEFELYISTAYIELYNYNRRKYSR